MGKLRNFGLWTRGRNRKSNIETLLMILWLTNGALCVQIRVPDSGQSRKFLEIYDQRNDKFLGKALFKPMPNTKLKMKVETLIESTVKYKSEQVRSMSEYIDSFEFSTSAKLGATYAGISGGFESSMSIKNELKTEREFILMIIRLTNRTVTKVVDPCSSDFDDSFQPDAHLGEAVSVGSHVVTGKTYGYSIEITLKVTSMSTEKSSSQQFGLKTTVGAICATFEASTSFGWGNSKKDSSEDISIKVSTKHLSYPYPLPTTWQDVGPFLANVTAYANRNGVIGGVLDYEVEELRLIQNCRRGSTQELSVHQVAYEIVLAATETVLQEIEVQENENLKLITGFKSVRNCLNVTQEIKFLLTRDEVISDMDAMRADMSFQLDAFRNNKINYTMYVSNARMNLEILFSKHLSLRNRIDSIDEQLVQTIEFVGKAASYGHPCIPRDDFRKLWLGEDQRPVYYLYRSSEIPYYLDNNATLGNFSESGRWIPTYYKYKDYEVNWGKIKFNVADQRYIPTILSLLYFLQFCNVWEKSKIAERFVTKCYLLDCELNEDLCIQMNLPTNLVGMYVDTRELDQKSL